MRYRLIKGRWVQPNDEPDRFIALPFGSGLNAELHEIRLRENNGVLELGVRNIGSTGRYTALLPPYKACVKHKFNDGNVYDLEIFLAVSDQEFVDLQALIASTHYLSSPKSGMFVGCRFLDREQEEQYLANCNSVRRASKPGSVFACAVIQTLFHGNPIGRSMVAERQIGSGWRELPRPEIVRELGLAWGSRFAVDDPFIKNGIGTLLADQLAVVSRRYRLPRASFVEVFRTVTKERCDEIVGGSEDWLTRAGYKVFREPQYTPPLWEWNSESGNRQPPKSRKVRPVYRKLYYLRDVRTV